MRIYVVEREGYDYSDQTLVYDNKEAAIDAMLSFALETTCIAFVNVLERNADTKKPFRLVEYVALKTLDGSRHYAVWKKQKELGLSIKEALADVSVFYETIHTVSTV